MLASFYSNGLVTCVKKNIDIFDCWHVLEQECPVLVDALLLVEGGLELEGGLLTDLLGDSKLE